jgi:TetR/AcrR family transcriptional regulator, transcriptional repressor for nem operon
MSRNDLRRSDAGDRTAERILDVAERLVQERGFNAFSYAHVAGEVGITTASLHYHFPGKAQLGEALIERYAQRFGEALEQLWNQEADAPQMLAGYADLYAQTLRDHRMCLCGMLAADYETLAPPVRRAVLSFFDDNERWLTRVLDQGRNEGALQFDGLASETARMLIGGLEGALLVARPYGDPERFGASASRLLASVSARDGDPPAAGALKQR